jgi:hypothetical protein
MDTPSAELDRAIREYLAPGAFAVEGGRDLFMEVNDTATSLVWMSTSTVEQADYDNLVVQNPLVKSGIGHASMDRAVFLSSPGAPGEAVLQRDIGGRQWINVAAPLKIVPPEVADDPLRITVDKAHVIGFEAGRSVSLLRLPHGDYVELVGENTADSQRILPAGGVIERVHLEQPWVVPLPTPTDTYFWFGEHPRSFQGPVTLPSARASP